MKIYLVNAFSINMLLRVGQDITFLPVSTNAVRNLYRNHDVVSAIGHDDLANILTSMIGTEIETNRISIELDRNSSLIVAQYRGPRLVEGTIELPENATIEFWQVYLL